MPEHPPVLAPQRTARQLILLLLIMGLPVSLIAGTVPPLTDFTPSQVISSTDVNANFEALQDTVDANFNASKTLWQEKFLSADTTGAGNVSEIGFANLTVGKTYRLSISLYMRTTNGSGFNVACKNGTTTLTVFNFDPAGAANGMVTRVFAFVATDTTVTFDGSVLNSTFFLYGSNNRSGTYAQLEELPYHEVTPQF